jgi:hypothetical protein
MKNYKNSTLMAHHYKNKACLVLCVSILLATFWINTLCNGCVLTRWSVFQNLHVFRQ